METVHTEEGKTFSCRYVVCTIPLSVLKTVSDTMFVPPLSAEKRTVIAKLKVGAYGKVVMQFKEAFWGTQHSVEQQHFMGSISNDPKEEFCLFLRYDKLKNVPLLVAFMIDDFARQMEKLTHQQVVERAVHSLQSIQREVTFDSFWLPVHPKSIISSIGYYTRNVSLHHCSNARSIHSNELGH